MQPCKCGPLYAVLQIPLLFAFGLCLLSARVHAETGLVRAQRYTGYGESRQFVSLQSQNTRPALLRAMSRSQCFEAAAFRHGVNPHLLRAIAHVESSGKADAVNINRQFRTYNEDIGLMQINSIWLQELAVHGIHRQHLLDACINIHVGAWILARQIRKYGNTWQAVGAYHSATPDLNVRYARRVHAQLQRDGVIAQP